MSIDAIRETCAKHTMSRRSLQLHQLPLELHWHFIDVRTQRASMSIHFWLSRNFENNLSPNILAGVWRNIGFETWNSIMQSVTSKQIEFAESHIIIDRDICDKHIRTTYDDYPSVPRMSYGSPLRNIVAMHRAMSVALGTIVWTSSAWK